METVVRRIGNSLGILLPRPVLDAARMDEGGLFSIFVEDGDTVVLRRVDPRTLAQDERVKALIEQNAGVLGRLDHG